MSNLPKRGNSDFGMYCCVCQGAVGSGDAVQRFLEQINVLGVENESVSQAGLKMKGIFKLPESRERMNVLKKG